VESDFPAQWRKGARLDVVNEEFARSALPERLYGRVRHGFRTCATVLGIVGVAPDLVDGCQPIFSYPVRKASTTDVVGFGYGT
jgi:hypothetical protein